MSAARARRLRPHIDYTHQLSIPLSTPSSRPQLNASFARFERETSNIIPKGSVFNPEFAMLFLGKLKLESRERINAFSKHLHNMPVHEMLRVAAVSAVKGRPSFPDHAYQHEPLSLGVASKLDYPPLKVDISGMNSPNGDSSTRILVAMVVDRTHRLEHFKHMILKSLFKAGFQATAPVASPITTTLMMTRLALWWVKNTDPKTGRSKAATPPLVDASDLIQGWNDFEWATNVQLEKMCIYRLGVMERLPGGEARQKQPVEVDSIKLPGFHESNSISKSS